MDMTAFRAWRASALRAAHPPPDPIERSTLTMDLRR